MKLTISTPPASQCSWFPDTDIIRIYIIGALRRRQMNPELADIRFIEKNGVTDLVLHSGEYSENEERAVVYCLSQINQLLTSDPASFQERLCDWSVRDAEKLREDSDAVDEGLDKTTVVRIKTKITIDT
jgi:hypothetical protein